jgi:hypothetical protein
MLETLTPETRATFAGIADVLIPEAEGMPSASQVKVHGEILDRILSLRPDLTTAFYRGVGMAAQMDAAQATNHLNQVDAEALSAVGLIAAAAYYMSPEVRTLIGYPGQEKRSFDADATPEYVANGMLGVVEQRGPIFRATPA